ncbi:hypothetical protein [Streptomyces sp. NBC_01431]|uniref:hypothetical protein n=1 Tax=Streptomyces sp. NBC_01431 TaxID=2903863 RepID=UPI002E3406E0|nr:hypothetical protein [Streptomyces sp. NBC_01431]
MSGNIQVWEADHSPSSHDAKVRQVLADVARTFAESFLSDGPTWDAVYMGLVAAAAALVTWILSLNKDDFIKERTFERQRNKTCKPGDRRQDPTGAATTPPSDVNAGVMLATTVQPELGKDSARWCDGWCLRQSR